MAINSKRKATLETLKFSMKSIILYMQDPEVFEVYVNPDGKIWLDTFSEGRVDTGKTMSADTAKQIIYNVAALDDQVVDTKVPIVSAEIPDTPDFDSARFQGVLPHIVVAPTINIRKHPKKIFTLDDYVKQKTITKEQKKTIIKAIHNKKNIIAAGGTKSGKTTLLNALLHEISKLNDRVIMIEDTPELRCTTKDYVSMIASDGVTMDDCLRSVLRQTPDRIIVGEVRGGEALTLLDAWSTGHSGGCSTVHSNSAPDTMMRLENMISRVSLNPQQITIAHAVDIIIYLKYTGTNRKIEQIISLEDYDSVGKKYIYKDIT